jgi:hypothetical protein
MQSNKVMWMCAGLGGFFGGYIPLLWGAEYFSFVSILFSGAGALFGIWAGFKLTHY